MRDAIQYAIVVHLRAHSYKLRVHPDGAVRVTVPKRYSPRAVEAFVRKNEPWIRVRLEAAKRNQVIHVSRKNIAALKETARMLVASRLQYFNQFYHFKYNAVTIRAQKSRWGSCSAKGNLSFNYKIATLPPALLDYIVVHELCHLREMNHSKRFWDLVAKTIPDYKERRARLRRVVHTHRPIS